MPNPRTASTFSQPSPVPKYMICGLEVLCTKQLIAIFSNASFTLVQTGLATVISFVNHKPPPTPPAHTFLYPLATSDRSNHKALVLPPTLFGPRSCHVMPETA